MDMNMAMLKQFAELKQQPCMMSAENFMNIQDFFFSLEPPLLAHHHHHQQSDFPANYHTHNNNNLPSSFHSDDSLMITTTTTAATTTVPVAAQTRTANEEDVFFHESKQREEVTREQPTTSISQNISCSASTTEFEGDTNKKRTKNKLGRGKKARSNEKEKEEEEEEEKAEEVVHVRAKRGQATDSHSIAERVRREKINKKMRCLQDLVPGCHKTMGMAGMLEEIINYVHSLQNQVEFLSMELATACSSYESNLQTEANRKTQGTSSHEAVVEMERWARREAYGDYNTSNNHSTWSL
ncbi:hypothetical protein ACOSQ3_026583 [Xanthoceras sorbifolium]